MQQEDHYRRTLSDITRQQNEQLQALFRRSEETEKKFLAFQKKHSDELAERKRILTSELFILKKELTTALAEKVALEERVKNFSMMDRENLNLRNQINDLRNDMSKLRRSMQEEMMNQIQEARTEQDEKDEESGFVVFVRGEGGNKSIKAATPEKLVERHTIPANFYFDILGRNLLQLIISKITIKDVDSIAQNPMALRVVNTLKHWMENYWGDFSSDPELLSDISTFIESLGDSNLGGILKTLTNSEISIVKIQETPPKPILPKLLIKRYSLAEQHTSPVGTSFVVPSSPLSRGPGSDSGSSLIATPSSNQIINNISLSQASLVKPSWGFKINKIPEVIEESRLKFIDIDPLEMARQITIMESRKELLDLAWMKDDKEIKAPNIMRMSRWTNHVIHWLISEIVSIKDNLKLRAQVYEKIVMLASYLEKLNNFNGVKEVLAALQSSSVYRLKKTKELVGIKYFKIYEDLTKATSSELNFKNLRSKVHAAEPPLIPFPGVYQGDLVFLDTCNKNKMDGNLVNFHKFQKMATYILELQSYQKKKYVLESVYEIQDYIRNYSVLDDDRAYNFSLICEPRA
ncbi:hypothetical protein HK096_008696 [Nowakowskiella sp. JEL0078]|nr:hypothetical protein HK096_008696 [Nowakowskiella sp. JEL0078]